MSGHDRRMMPLIAPQRRQARRQISVHLEEHVIAELDAYRTYIQSSREYVITQALGRVFRHDRGFQAQQATTGDGRVPHQPADAPTIARED